MSGEGKALLAVGKAQGALLKLTKDLLREDPSDGLRAAEWTARHKAFFATLCDDMQSYGLLDEGDLEAAEKAAGENQ